MPDLTLRQALADPKLRPVVLAWATRTFIIDEITFLVDMLQKKEARQIYRDYIADGAPKPVNLPHTTVQPIRDLVARGKFKPTELRTLLVDATEEQFGWLAATFTTGNNAFLTSREYREYQTAGLTRDRNVAAALNSLALPEAKAKQIEPLLTLYLKARTPQDAYEAYKSMQRLAGRGDLDRALTAGGKPPTDVIRQGTAGKAPPGKSAQLEALRREAKSFEAKVSKVAAADKSGGPTWKAVQLAAQRVPQSILPMLMQIEDARRDPALVARHLKTLTAQWDAIPVKDVEKYKKEHGAGGAKTRGKLAAALTPKAVAAEKSRVALCELFLQRYKALDTLVDRLKVEDLV